MTGTQGVSSPVCYSASWNVPLASFQTNFHSKCNDGLYPASLTSWHKLRIPVILRSHDCIIIPLRASPYSSSALAETCILISPTLAFSFSAFSIHLLPATLNKLNGMFLRDSYPVVRQEYFSKVPFPTWPIGYEEQGKLLHWPWQWGLINPHWKLKISKNARGI